ncbi:MAG TPA: amino acid adenylation domain-containing protein [Acidisarcina sp.]
MEVLEPNLNVQTVTVESYAFPLTFAQTRLWFLDQLEPDQTSYLVAWALRIDGNLNSGGLEHSINQVVRRHEIFRTTFKMSGEEPVQVVASSLHVPLPVIDLSHLDLADREAEARRLAKAEADTPVSLSKGPLLRTQLLRLSANDHLLLLTTHHIVFDGWSRSILLRELSAAYESYVSGKPLNLPELAIQYGDFAAWQREHVSGENLARHFSYWEKQLQDSPEALELPTDRPRPAVQTYNGALSSVRISKGLTDALKSASRVHGVTLNMTMLAAFQVLLSRYSGQDDIVVGSPIANRNRSELEGLIGFFANTLVLRTRLDGDPAFSEVLRRVKETTLSADAHQDMPFEKLVEGLRPERSLSHSPLFQVLFSLRNTPPSQLRLGDLAMKFLGGGNATSKYDLSLYLEEDAEGIRGKLEYNMDLFDEATIVRMQGHYKVLLESAVAGPETRISELDILAPAERQQIVVDWNRTEQPYKRDLCLHELVEQQAARRADSPAVVFQNEYLTYGELNARANQVAYLLWSRGIGRGHRVGIYLDRSLNMMVALLGALKSGAAYVPLDPAYPAERVRATLDAARITMLVTEEWLLPQLPEVQVTTLCLERDRTELAKYAITDPAAGSTPADSAYVIFTSGSTGQPKGVEVEHGNLVNLLTWMQGDLALRDGDVFPALASFAFDMSVPELYLPLTSGGMLALGEKHLPADGEDLALFLRSHHVTVVHATPTTWSLLLDAGFTGAGLKRCIGAEPLPYELFARLMDAAPGTPLYNFYGPTETTVWSTFHRFESSAERIVIGRPLANTQIYILESSGQPTPVGIAGEIHIGGDGVAHGYLFQPELTAEKFIPDPFSSQSEARLYKTGDLGRYLPDGRIEFAGRRDHQVKIRGFRIELSEIETTLAKHASVRECVAMAREDVAGDKRLVAYIVPALGASPGAAELRDWVRERLPEYMIPSAVVSLERFPLTPNGKVDRKQLPAPVYEASATQIGEMASPVEEMIAGIWAGILMSGEVTPTANFFDLGGHSLLAVKVVTAIRRAFNVELPLRAMFEEPTVAGLAARVTALVREGGGQSAPPIVPVTRGGPFPLSFAQQRLWFLDQLEPNSSFYNVPWSLRFSGDLDLEALKRALDEIGTRHDSLRTTFKTEDGVPVQIVAPEFRLLLSTFDVSHLPLLEREEEARRLVREEQMTPFSLSLGPLFRTHLVKVGEQDHILTMTMHHAVSDGWSLGILSGELAALYEAFQGGKPSPLAALPFSYGDFAVWQRAYLEGGALQSQLTYWKEHMAGAPPAIELPTDRARPPMQTFHGAKEIALLPPELLTGLRALSRTEGLTLFMTLLAAFNVLMSRYSGQQDIVVGTASAGRHHAGTEGLIGFFTNTLVLRSDLAGEPTFRELTARVRETTLSAYANQDVPFEKLVEELNPVRDSSRSPLFQVMFIQQNAFQSSHSFGSLKASGYGAGGAAAKVDLLVNVSEHGGGLRCAFEYNTDLFDEATIVRMQGHYKVLLESAVAGPESRISELEILDAAERHQIVVEWNQTAQPYERGLCVHQVFEREAIRRAGSPAVAFGGEYLTYGDLNARANQLAHLLRLRGVGGGHRVGVYLDRSLNMMVALLGIWKSGAAYVPLDPAYPAERVRGTLEAGKVSLLVTEEWMLPQLPDISVAALCLERDRPALAGQPNTNPEGGATPGDPAYVMFTSGSTGKPKGVVVGHGGVLNQITWMQRELEFTENDVFPAITSFAFDVSVPELFIPLISGGMVALGEKHLAADGEELARFVARHRAGVVQATPTTWSLLLDAGFTGAGLKRCIGAEPLPKELFTRLMDAAPGTPLINVYGPTETTVWSTFHRFESSAERIVIGRPLANTQIYILESSGQPAPVGIAGEIHIGGDGVAHGYLFQPELTAEKFIPDPFSSQSEARMYKTGDLGRYLPDGRIEFAGRRDHQVKIRGFRIELSEIETVLSRHPAVRECVVIAREDQPGNKFLAAYVVPSEPGAPVDFAELRSLARQYLPEYMVPVGWLAMERLPLTPNGKVDRLHLPLPEHRGARAASEAGAEPAKPSTLIEIRLARIWEEVLNVSPIGPDDDFFTLGGHSLLAVQMMSRARDAFHCVLPLALLFSYPKLGELANAISTERGKAPFKTTVPIRKSGSKTPLFCISRPNVNALGYIFLARGLSADHPVIGVQFQMEKDENAWAHEQAAYEYKAEEYIRDIRNIQPHGPYLLTGYCEGAHIAFEIARKLEEMDQEVAMLAVLDQWPVENTRDRRKFMAAVRRRSLQRFMKSSFKEKSHSVKQFILEKTLANGGSPAAAAEAKRRRLMIEQRNKRYWPGPDYVPTRFGGKITLFRAEKQDPLRINDYKMGWGERAAGGVEVVPIQGEHDFILREPHVIDLAAKMQDVIDRSLEASAQKAAQRRQSQEGQDYGPRQIHQDEKTPAHA